MSRKSEAAKQAKELKDMVKHGNISAYLLTIPWCLSCVGLGITGGYFLAQVLSMDVIGVGISLGLGGALGLVVGFAPIFIPYFRNIAPLSILGITSLLIMGLFFQPTHWQQTHLWILPTAFVFLLIAVHDLMRQQANQG